MSLIALSEGVLTVTVDTFVLGLTLSLAVAILVPTIVWSVNTHEAWCSILGRHKWLKHCEWNCWWYTFPRCTHEWTHKCGRCHETTTLV